MGTRGPVLAWAISPAREDEEREMKWHPVSIPPERDTEVLVVVKITHDGTRYEQAIWVLRDNSDVGEEDADWCSSEDFYQDVCKADDTEVVYWAELPAMPEDCIDVEPPAPAAVEPRAALDSQR
jgi:hypothetical protein